jgi:hypothetical protein
MNERIKQLIKAAGGIGHDEDGQELTPMLVGSSLEKFAELIVRECAKIAGKAEYSDTWLEPVEDAIKKHFGVEE